MKTKKKPISRPEILWVLRKAILNLHYSQMRNKNINGREHIDHKVDMEKVKN